MYLYFFFITYLQFCALANEESSDDYYDYHYGKLIENYEQIPVQGRHSDFPVTTRPCEHLGRTSKSPYVVIILFKTSGSFLGMGGIVDRRTVITSSHAVAHTSDNTQNLLVLAGNRSPWWGEGAQVRKVKKATVNDFELAMLTTEKDFDFNNRVSPIPLMRKLQPDWYHFYGDNMAVFGLAMDEHMSPGERVVKSALYYTATQTLTHIAECERYYLDIVTGNYNVSYHVCLYSNGSFCSGNMGSPVIGITKVDGRAELIGVVVRSDCMLVTKPTLTVNLAWFDSWIRANSLLHYKIQPKPRI